MLTVFVVLVSCINYVLCLGFSLSDLCNSSSQHRCELQIYSCEFTVGTRISNSFSVNTWAKYVLHLRIHVSAAEALRCSQEVCPIGSQIGLNRNVPSNSSKSSCMISPQLFIQWLKSSWRESQHFNLALHRRCTSPMHTCDFHSQVLNHLQIFCTH